MAEIRPVSTDILNHIAAGAPKPPPSQSYKGNSQPFDVETWLAKHNIEIKRVKDWQGGKVYKIQCQWDSSHGDDGYVTVKDGIPGAGCFHNGCEGKGWIELREKIEPGYREHRVNPANAGGNGHKEQSEIPRGEEAEVIENTIKHRTPLGLAKRLVRKHGQDLRYCYEYGKWLIYDGRRWAHDSGAGAVSRIKDIIRDLYIEAANESDKSEREAIAKYAMGCERGNTLNDALFLAQSEPGIAVKPGEMDTGAWVLNCLNGTVDLKTGELLPHDRKRLITKLVNLNFNPDAECPRFIKILRYATNNDRDLEFYLQRVFGYLLTGDVSECALFFFYGPTKTGKTTITGTIYDILGSDYAKDTPVSTITVNKYNNQANDDLARLAGSRMVKVSETESGSKLATGLIKYLTGNESEITGKFLYHERFNYKPTFKLVMTGNVKPKIPGNDQAMYERLHLIPFRSYVPPKERIKDLREVVLRQEHEGILAWCVRGCLAYIENGDLGKPDTVKDEVKEYQKEMDTVGQWLDECCTTDPARKTPLATLFASYEQWCKETDNEAMGKKKFSQDLSDRGFATYREDKERGKCGLYVGSTGK